MQKSTLTVNGSSLVKRRLATLSLTLAASVGLLAGCAGFQTTAGNTSTAVAAIKGSVFGGQQPIIGATVQVYAANASLTGAAGYSSLSLPLGTPVLTSVNGNYTLPSFFCPASPNDQIYIVATGGNPGNGIVNPNLSLMTAVGSCSTYQSASPNVNINEVTTVASTYALAGFMSDYLHVGSSSTNYTGLVNAFNKVNNLVNTATGAANTITPAYATQAPGTTVNTFHSSVPQAELNTLGNILSACVNSDPSTDSSCSTLFSTVSGSPTDTVGAALAVAQNPGYNVSAIYGLSSGASPFAPALGAPGPNDWTVGINYIGGGLGGNAVRNDSEPQEFAIDQNGNLFIINLRNNSLTELNNLGAPLTPNTGTGTTVTSEGGLTNAALSSVNKLAIDTNGNVYITSSTNGNTVKYIPSSGFSSTLISGGGNATNSFSITIDGNDNLYMTFAAQSMPGGIAKYSSTGVPYSSTGFITGLNSTLNNIAIDNAGSLFLDDTADFVKYSSAGTQLKYDVHVLNSPQGSAIDSNGVVWVVAQSINAFTIFANDGTTGPTYDVTTMKGCLDDAVDGLGHIFVACGNGAGTPNVTEVDQSANPISPPDTGFEFPGGQANSVYLHIDNSGNVWVLNPTLKSSVTELVGLAAPSYAPLALALKNGAVGTRP
jgi:hypothetical protein